MCDGQVLWLSHIYIGKIQTAWLTFLLWIQLLDVMLESDCRRKGEEALLCQYTLSEAMNSTWKDRRRLIVYVQGRW